MNFLPLFLCPWGRWCYNTLKTYRVQGGNMGKVELLAPVGDRDALIAAVQNGADAVYLGGRLFGARANASNFDGDGLAWAVDYCHLAPV